jgi:hypothetical protein
MEDPEHSKSEEHDSKAAGSDAMAKADVANGERPEQPSPSDHAAHARPRTNHRPVGEEQAATNRAEESPS